MKILLKNLFSFYEVIYRVILIFVTIKQCPRDTFFSFMAGDTDEEWKTVLKFIGSVMIQLLSWAKIIQ